MTVEDLIQELQRFPKHATVAVAVPCGVGAISDVCEVERVDQANYGKTVVQLHISDVSL